MVLTTQHLSPLNDSMSPLFCMQPYTYTPTLSQPHHTPNLKTPLLPLLSPPGEIPTTMMDRTEQEQLENTLLPFPFPALSISFAKLLSLQADIIYDCLLSISSPFLSLFSQSLTRAEEVKDSVDSAVQVAATRIPATVAGGGGVLLRRLLLGLLGAAYVCMVLIFVMVVSVVLGVGLVGMWVEEPVLVREKLHFDYTDVNPNAVFYFGGGGGGGGGVPVGHTFYVYLVLLMPESDYNREIGMFQVIGELISTNGNVMARLSHPCMLQFQSLPVRFMRTFLIGIPLLLGITTETQTIGIPIIKHKEAHPKRTDAIKITLAPRAGTSYLPQLYEAEILIHSELPWGKELVRSWKWTFYVWMSIYIYILLLVVLVLCFRPLIFPVMTASFSVGRDTYTDTDRDSSKRRRVCEGGEVKAGRRGDREISETLRRWKQSRNKRKAMLMHGVLPENIGGSSASSIEMTREDSEDVGDSESVCL